MPDKLEIGLSGQAEFAVTEEKLATNVGSGLVNVFSTAMMIGGMEAAAVNAVQPFLDEDQTTVGVEVSVRHKAATPVGMRTSYHAELIGISGSGRALFFKISAHDEKELIGEGTHRRVIVNRSEFERKARDKAQK